MISFPHWPWQLELWEAQRCIVILVFSPVPGTKAPQLSSSPSFTKPWQVLKHHPLLSILQNCQPVHRTACTGGANILKNALFPNVLVGAGLVGARQYQVMIPVLLYSLYTELLYSLYCTPVKNTDNGPPDSLLTPPALSGPDPLISIRQVGPSLYQPGRPLLERPIFRN